MDQQLDPTTLNKVISKLYSIAQTKVFNGELPTIKVREFKYLLGTSKLGASNWFSFAKCLEEKGLVDLHGVKCLEIHLTNQSLAVIYKLKLLDRKKLSSGRRSRKK